MLPRSCVVTTVLWLATLALGTGCGKGGPETASLTGTVTLDGNPVAQAGVMFTGPAGGVPVSAVTDDQGQFRLEAPVGTNSVAVSKTKQAGAGPGAKPAGDDDMLMPAGGAQRAEPEWVVPKKYADTRNSGLKVDVKRGMAPVKLELSSK